MFRVLVGYVLMYAALEASARLAAGLGQTLVTPVAGVAGLVAALLVVIVLHGRRTVKSAFVELGFGRPRALPLKSLVKDVA